MSSPYSPDPNWGTRQVYDYAPAPVEIHPPARPMPRQRLWVHILLFVLTVFSTVLVGGVSFSAGLLSILLAHEFGHYFAAKYYKVPASLPYFIPFPISLFGTLGAVIRMSPRIPHRRALFDIAAAGPLAGLVLAIPLTYVGILFSQLLPKSAVRGDVITLGEPLLYQGLSWLAYGSLGQDIDLLLHPLAFAGWAGMFVTALNLLPIGQLDGGHIVHSLFGMRSRQVAFGMFGSLALYSVIQRNFTWLPLLILLLVIGIQHPRSQDDGLPLGRGRLYLGILLAIVFLTCFSLDPLQLRPQG